MVVGETWTEVNDLRCYSFILVENTKAGSREDILKGKNENGGLWHEIIQRGKRWMQLQEYI